MEVLQSMSAPLPEDDTKKLLMAHEKAGRDSMIDFMEFLSGKKYVNKLYLMASFEGKKKKKKGGKGGRGSIIDTVQSVCIKSMGLYYVYGFVLCLRVCIMCMG